MLFFLFFPIWTEGAVLYLEPSEDKFQIGDTFLVEIKIDTEEECINTVEAELKFSSNLLKVINFNQGLSIITLWVKPPKINQEIGLISFAGGIPGGYCGEMPGDPGPSHILGKIIFQASNEGEAKLNFLEGTQVLLNDGLGNSAKLTFKEAIFTILSEKEEPLKNEWQGELLKDIFLPEPFEIEIHQDPKIFDNKYFIIFSTADKQTGIDYYEIKEGKGDWKRAESPYLLEDQGLKSIIKVKAVDKAGNERTAEYMPSKKPFPYWIIIIIIGLVIISWYIISKIKKQISK